MTFISDEHQGPCILETKNTKSLAKKEEKSALRKHCKEKHKNEKQKFEMNVTGSYSNDAMLRLISEGFRIDQVPEGSLINCKNEWNYFHIPRAVVAHDHMKSNSPCWLT